MLAETITVTTTPTTIKDLIADKRSSENNLPSLCRGVILVCKLSETAVITMKDAHSHSGVPVLDVVGNNRISVSFEQFNIEDVFLQTDTGTADIGIIVEQSLGGGL